MHDLKESDFPTTPHIDGVLGVCRGCLVLFGLFVDAVPGFSCRGSSQSSRLVLLLSVSCLDPTASTVAQEIADLEDLSEIELKLESSWDDIVLLDEEADAEG
jgi:hypothetical protein